MSRPVRVEYNYFQKLAADKLRRKELCLGVVSGITSGIVSGITTGLVLHWLLK